MRNLIRNVSHSSRCAPFRTPNLAKNPARPVLAGGGTPAAAAVLSFVVGITGGKNQRKSSEWKNQSYNDRLRTPCDAGEISQSPRGRSAEAREMAFPTPSVELPNRAQRSCRSRRANCRSASKVQLNSGTSVNPERCENIRPTRHHPDPLLGIRIGVVHVWRLHHGDQMVARWQHPFVVPTICETRNVPAVDIQVECRVIAEIRRPPNDHARFRLKRRSPYSAASRRHRSRRQPAGYRRHEQRV